MEALGHQLAQIELGSSSKESLTNVQPPPITPPHSRLLALPKELRLITYEFVLQEPDPITIPKVVDNPRPSLLHINKQIRCETCELYYKLNDFRAEVDGDHPGLKSFIDRACFSGPGNLSKVHHLNIEFDFDPVLREKMRHLDRALMGFVIHLELLPSSPLATDLYEAADVCVSLVKALAYAGLRSSALAVTSPYVFDSRLRLPDSSGERIVAEMRRDIEEIFEEDTSAMFVRRV